MYTYSPQRTNEKNYVLLSEKICVGPYFTTLKMYSEREREREELRGIFVRERSETTKRVKLFECFVLCTFMKNTTTEN